MSIFGRDDEKEKELENFIEECDSNKEEEKSGSVEEKEAISSAEDVSLVKVNANITAVTSKLVELERMFEERIRFTEFEEKSRQNMNDELQEYKRGMYFEIVKPIFLDIISFREDMIKTVAQYRCQHPNEENELLFDFESYALEDLAGLLENHGIEIYKSNIGDDFSTGRQRLRKPLIETDNEALNGKIAVSLSSGYRYKNQVIYGEWVQRFIFKKVDGLDNKEE